MYCLSPLGWITVSNEGIGNLDSLFCAGMASVKGIQLMALSKIQDGSQRGLLFCSPCPFKFFVLEYP